MKKVLEQILFLQVLHTFTNFQQPIFALFKKSYRYQFLIEKSKHTR